MENKSTVFTGIIPARFNSSRFPGKPLATILGKPMFWHVYTRAVQCKALSAVYLATDHEEIFSCAQKHGIPVVMTSKDHKSGSDRVLEAARILKLPDNSVAINIQGDEPALNPEMLDQLIVPFISDPEVKICTLARPTTADQVRSKNTVKVVFSKSNKALYFSRNIIPYTKDDNHPCYVHVGLYAFRIKYLKIFSELRQSRLEKMEQLEQLRILESDIPIHVVETRCISHGVDIPEDINNVTKIMQEKNNESNISP
ncbi:MAG: 3-deoxy-manno-octulosonate cytidylyltransferase [Desulfonatronovibrio sp.]